MVMPEVTYVKNKNIVDSNRIKSLLCKQYVKEGKVSINDRLTKRFVDDEVRKEKHQPNWKSKFLDQVRMSITRTFDDSFWENKVKPKKKKCRLVKFSTIPKYPEGTWHRFCACFFCRWKRVQLCLLYTSPSPRDRTRARMPSSA